MMLVAICLVLPQCMHLLAPLQRYGASKVVGSRLDQLGSRDVIGHVTIRLPGVNFL